MTKQIFTLIFLLKVVQVSVAQNCNCEAKFSFLKNYIEKNYAGFQEKVRKDNRVEYDVFSQNILKPIQKTTNSIRCTDLMNEWLAFFKDGHIQIWDKAKSKDTIAIRDLMERTEMISISKANLAILEKSNGVEGIYYDTDSTYKIAILKNKTSSRDFVGVIISSKSPFWKPGQIKLELKQTTKNTFTAKTYNNIHSLQIQNFIFDKTSFHNGEWLKKGAARENKQNDLAVQSKKISDKTFYIKIGTFNTWNAKAIDSVFKTNENILKSTPNLILDLRENGGGSDFAYQSISPYLYTNLVYIIGEDVLSTDDNIKSWRALLDEDDNPQSFKEEIKTIITKMEAYPGQFIPFGKDDTTKLDKVEPFPQKVVVLIDNHCASTTEQFLLEARQSKKVTLMGQHTEGVLDYANMRNVVFPCSSLMLAYATTRSRRINIGQGIDNIGIQPNIAIPMDKDWIKEATKYLEK